MRDKMSTIALMLATALTTAVLITALSALADSNPDTDQVGRVVPYQGTLEKDGRATNGTLDLVFQLFDGASAQTPVWEETLSVTVFSGRFSVLLGSSSTQSEQKLGKALSDADDLHLAVSVKPDAETLVPLSNRLRFLPVPYSFWSTASTNLKVSSIDSPGSSMCLNCREAKTVTVGGNLGMKGTDLIIAPADPNVRGDGGRAMVHGGGDQLVLSYSGDFAGGVHVHGPPDFKETALTVNGTDKSAHNPATLAVTSGNQTMTFDGDAIDTLAGQDLWLNHFSKSGVQVGGNLNVAGAISSPNLHNRSSGYQDFNVDGGVWWGQTRWGAWTMCPAGFYMCGIVQAYEPAGQNDDTGLDDLSIRCCPF